VEGRPPHHRILAALALVALLAAFGVTTWWIVTDAIDLGRGAEPAPKRAAVPRTSSWP
jgi:hypothetical protein